MVCDSNKREKNWSCALKSEVVSIWPKTGTYSLFYYSEYVLTTNFKGFYG
jgi:hypothetical protein